MLKMLGRRWEEVTGGYENCIIMSFKILSRVRVIIDGVLDWMIGFIDTLCIKLGTAGNTALSLMYTHYSSPLYTH
jgi:hypothetical protein